MSWKKGVWGRGGTPPAEPFPPLMDDEGPRRGNPQGKRATPTRGGEGEERRAHRQPCQWPSHPVALAAGGVRGGNPPSQQGSQRCRGDDPCCRVAAAIGATGVHRQLALPPVASAGGGNSQTAHAEFFPSHCQPLPPPTCPVCHCFFRPTDGRQLWGGDAPLRKETTNCRRGT